MNPHLVLTYFNRCSCAARVDFDTDTGEMDVRYEVGQLAYTQRYAATPEIFERIVIEGAEIGDNIKIDPIKPGREGYVREQDLLATRYPDSVRVTVATFPRDFAALRAQWGAEQFAKRNDVSALTRGAVFQ